MTYLEKLQQDHPEVFNSAGRCFYRHCPGYYGYPEPTDCQIMECNTCWSREVALSRIEWIPADNKAIVPEVDKSYLCTLEHIRDKYRFWDKVEYLDFGWKVPGTVKVISWCDPILYEK